MIFKIWLFYMHERKVLYIFYIIMHVLRSPQRSGRPACHIFLAGYSEFCEFSLCFFLFIKTHFVEELLHEKNLYRLY